jgi:hypothetical protein
MTRRLALVTSLILCGAQPHPKPALEAGSNSRCFRARMPAERSVLDFSKNI